MWLAYSYVDVALGLFSTKEIAEQAMLDYHGNENDARMFGIIEEYQVDVTREGKCYRAPVEPVAPLVQQLPPTVSRLPLSGSYTPAQAVQQALQDAHRLEHVMCLGEYKEEDGKRAFFLIPSKMDLKIALWIHRRLGLYIDQEA